MPFLKEFIINEKTKIKLWKVILGELSPKELNNQEIKLFKLKKSNVLREQFLATRKILALENSDYIITYDTDGKPSLNAEHNISISHSHQIAAIAISNNCKIGLDVQLKEKKIFNIQHKFLNKSEILNIGESPSIDTLTMNGKPYLNNKHTISISHSHEIAALVVSNKKKIGLDVQFRESKILKIQNKFLNKFEKINIGEDPSIHILTMVWTSKESIYKAIGLKGISFSKNIKIDKVTEKDKTGKGYYINGMEKVKFDLKFFYLDEYIVCYANQNL